MRLVWCANEGVSADRCHCGGLYVHSRCTGCRIHHTRRDALKRERGLKPAAVRFYHPLVGPRQRLPQLKDISDLQVLRAVVAAKKGMLREYPYDILMRELGVPMKLAYRAMERASERGLVNYGVSLRTCWLDDKGRAMLTDEELAEYDAAQDAWMRYERPR